MRERERDERIRKRSREEKRGRCKEKRREKRHCVIISLIILFSIAAFSYNRIKR
jgi:hypothetical protein